MKKQFKQTLYVALSALSVAVLAGLDGRVLGTGEHGHRQRRQGDVQGLLELLLHGALGLSGSQKLKDSSWT